MPLRAARCRRESREPHRPTSPRDPAVPNRRIICRVKWGTRTAAHFILRRDHDSGGQPPAPTFVAAHSASSTVMFLFRRRVSPLGTRPHLSQPGDRGARISQMVRRARLRELGSPRFVGILRRTHTSSSPPSSRSGRRSRPRISVRSLARTLWAMLAMWVRTVAGAMKSRRPISAVMSPSLSSSMTWRSRDDNR